MALSLSSTFTGRVVSVNEKGIKLDGHADWLNFSKFAEDLVAPGRGQCVTVTVDRQGFIRSVQNADDDSTPLVSYNGAPERSSGQSRERTITRLAVLKAAAEFGAARPSLKSGDVLAIAASWERWINREPDTTYDLTDAF